MRPGGGDVRGHTLIISAAHYLPVSNDGIPTGQELAVAGTARDFHSQPVELGLACVCL